MKEIVPMVESNLFFLLFLVVVPPFLLFFFFKYTKSSALPPGPFSWPVIGNILNMGKKPHVSLTQLAKLHGDIISLRLGTQLFVIGSTPATAIEILKTHDRLLSGRSIPHAAPAKNPTHTHLSVVWSDCTNQWSNLRTICRSELFSAKAIESQSNLREEKVVEMVKFLGRKEGQVVEIGEVVFVTIMNMLSNIFVSEDFMNMEAQEDAEKMKGLMRSLVESGAAPSVADFYPILSTFDLLGLKKKTKGLFGHVCGLWEGIMKQRRGRKESDIITSQRDFMDVLLAKGFTNEQINCLLLELFAGSNNITSTIEWTMAELIKNQQVLKNVCLELEKEINGNVVKDCDLSRLPYLHSCIKETLRLHPAVPFLLPHRAIETCKVMNYTIPKDSQVFVNVWAIGRDPKNWNDPLMFKPDRFLDSSVDMKFNDFALIPFGAGRRICPGLPMATKQIALILASLINNFDWSLPKGMHPSELDMEEEFGITLQKQQSLFIIPKVKI